MGCSKHFLGFQWEHHAWRRRVSASEIVTGEKLNLLARVVPWQYVRCQQYDVCDVCGKVRQEGDCLCDFKVGEHCRLRREWLAESSTSTG